MKNKIIYILLLCFPFYGISQEGNSVPDIKKNSLYVEIGGQGVINSICFDKLFHTNKKIKNTYTGGISFMALKYQYWGGLTFSYNFLTGQKSHHLELGFGLTLASQYNRKIDCEYSSYDSTGALTNHNRFIGTSVDYYSYITPKIGYRFQKINGGILIRLTFTPMVFLINRYGPIKESPYREEPTYEYFKSDASPNYAVYPWFGISIGYTFKNCK